MSDDTPEATGARKAKPHRWYRLALLITLVLCAITIVTLPITMTSTRDAIGRAPKPVYDFLTGRQVTGADVAAAQADAIYVNLGLIGLDVGSGLATVAVSGNRRCMRDCPSLTLTLSALDDEVEQRRGLPPSVTLTLGPAELVFSQSAQLPVRGQPNLYPFDDYQLWLGVAVVATAPDGSTQELDAATVATAGAVTLQNRISEFVMPPPEPIDPTTVQSATDPFAFLVVQDVMLERPAYIKRMSLTLIMLIAISATLAVFMRGFSELILGIGGLILGVWGVRSVLMPLPLPVVTTIDLALSWVIFLLLFGLALRAVMYFYRLSGLPAPPWSGSDGEE